MIPVHGLEVLLRRIAELASKGRADLPGLFLLDEEGRELASGFPGTARPAVEFGPRPGGEPHVRPKEARLRVRTCPVALAGRRVATLALVHAAAAAASAAASLLAFARAATELLLQKNAELDNLSEAVNRLFEEQMFLREIAREIGEASDLPEFCGALAGRLGELLLAPRVAIALGARDRPEFRLVGAHGLPAPGPEGWPIGAGATGRVIESGKTSFVEGTESLPADALPFEREAERSLLVTPILDRDPGKAIGAIVAMDGRGERGFGSVEASLLLLVGELVSAVLTRLQGAEMRREIQVARRIVEGLLPRQPPRLRKFALAGRLIPAHEVGGDYFDFLPMGPGRIGIVVADVSGHNLPATLLMTVVRAAFHWEASSGRSASQMMTRVARLLHEDLARAELFLSMALLILDEEGGLSYANAGHPSPLLRRADGRFEALSAEGPVAGVVPNATYEEARTRLHPDDCLLLYTDGIEEAARGDEMFGLERLRQALDAEADRSPEEILASVFRKVESFCGGAAADDLTVVVLKGNPETIPALAAGGAKSPEVAR